MVMSASTFPYLDVEILAIEDWTGQSNLSYSQWEKKNQQKKSISSEEKY